MSEHASPEPQSTPEAGDLGLSDAEWDDRHLAYNFGLIEPNEGTVEAAAFQQMDEFARQEAERIAAADARDAEYHRQQAAAREALHQAEPGAGQ
jgi:hypothetical protein